MPDVSMPNGDIVNFPDDMPKEQIKGLISKKFNIGESAKGLAMTAAQGIPFVGTFLDEAAAGIVTPPAWALKNALGAAGLPGGEKVSIGQIYDAALNLTRDPIKDFRAAYPKTAMGSEVGTSLATGLPLGMMALGAKAGQAANIGSTALQGAIRGGTTGLGGGLLSGGLYGFGAGEGGAGERAGSAVISGALGGTIGGAVGSAIGGVAGSLAGRARRLLEIKRSQQSGAVPPINTPQGYIAPSNNEALAVEKIVERLRRDYPDPVQFQKALDLYQSGDGTLAELGGQATQDLALGSAQYPSGKGVMNEFFDGAAPSPGQAPTGGAVAAARDNVTASLEKSVSGNTDFLGTLDDVLAKGRKAAAPLYKKSESKLVNITPDVMTKEVKDAIASARKTYPTELEGFADNSVKVLDYAKKVLDDEIGTAQRAGQGNFAASRTQIKNNLLAQIDDQVPSYAKARAKAGDYLSVKSAMEKGRAFKGKPDEIARQFKKLGDAEKDAYRMGVVQNLRDSVDSVKDSGNSYSKIFGSPSLRAKIKAVLPEEQYQQLKKDLWASDRIYSIRNKILGNSTTASKQISAQEFAGDTAETFTDIATKGFARGGASSAMRFVKKYQAGLSDKTAKDVARILTATSEQARLKIIRQISDSIDPKNAVSELKKGGSNTNALQVYFAIQDSMKPFRTSASAASGTLGGQPLHVTVRPSYANQEGNQ